MSKNFILSKASANEKLHRMALQIAENISDDTADIILIGVAKNGLAIAEEINTYLKKYIHSSIEVLSVALNKVHPKEVTLSKDMDFNDKNLILIDDVSNSGKTLLYALKPLLAFNPRRIQTLVMIERMHKVFPIKPDYVGLSVATAPQDNIEVIIENGEIIGAKIR